MIEELVRIMMVKYHFTEDCVPWTYLKTSYGPQLSTSNTGFLSGNGPSASQRPLYSISPVQLGKSEYFGQSDSGMGTNFETVPYVEK